MPTPRPKPKPTTRKVSAANLALTRERLQRLCGFLQALPPESFDYSDWVSEADADQRHPCGTVCCAAGWLPKVDPKAWGWYATKDTAPCFLGALCIYRRGEGKRTTLPATVGVVRALSEYFPAMRPQDVQVVFIDVADLYLWAAPDPAFPHTRHLVTVIQYWLDKGRLPRSRSLAW